MMCGGFFETVAAIAGVSILCCIALFVVLGTALCVPMLLRRIHEEGRDMLKYWNTE